MALGLAKRAWVRSGMQGVDPEVLGPDPLKMMWIRDDGRIQPFFPGSVVIGGSEFQNISILIKLKISFLTNIKKNDRYSWYGFIIRRLGSLCSYGEKMKKKDFTKKNMAAPPVLQL